jgi:hypothetical protein
MKQIVSLILVLFTTALFSQSKKTIIPFKHAQLIEMTLLSQLIIDLPPDKTNLLYEILGNMDGKLCNIQARGPQLSADIKELFKKAELNSKIFIIVLTADGKTKLKDVAIKVTE